MKNKICLSILISTIIISLLLPSCSFGGNKQGLSFLSSDEQTKKIYEYLCSVEGTGCLSGQQESTWMDSPEYEMDYIFNASGKYPAIRGLDYMNDDFEGVNERAVDWWNKGGLVTICWHCGSDFSGAWKESQETEIKDWDKALTEGTDEYNALIKGMDKAADALNELKEKGVTVIWRPFHEADGGWFWWGKGGSENFVKLWRIMYNHYTKERNLNNLIWVQGFSHNGEKINKWYVGDGFCDIVGADSYDGGGQNELYKTVKNVHAKNKPICYHECGENPTAEQLKETKWLWFMTWHTEYLTDNNSEKEIKDLYTSDYVITLDELPIFNEKKGEKDGMSDTDIQTEEVKSLKLDNVLDSVDWLGKSTKEIDVPEEYIINRGSFKEINIDGFIFSHECYGTVYLNDTNPKENRKYDRVFLIISNYSIDECKRELSKLYGEPVSEGEEPYVESLGGVVSWTHFETENLRIELKTASKHNFYTLEFKLKSNDA